LSEKFENILNNPDFFHDVTIPQLDDWRNLITCEGDYNDSYITNRNFLVGDRVFFNNIELADLIRFENNNIYLYHNKVGY